MWTTGPMVVRDVRVLSRVDSCCPARHICGQLQKVLRVHPGALGNLTSPAADFTFGRRNVTSPRLLMPTGMFVSQPSALLKRHGRLQ
jgi:hypothetical protein